MTLSTNTRPRLRRLLVPLIVAATIVVPMAPAAIDNGPPVKGENYYVRGIPAIDSGISASRGADNGPPVKGENYYARGLPAWTPEPAASVPTSSAFQWDDAAVGAGSSLAIVGLAMGGYLVLRRRHLHVKLS
jgi:hypothetical protein